MEYIHYNIAGHSLLIETTDLAKTKSLIPSFDPFFVEKEDGNKDILFRFIGNKEIIIPELDPVDILNINGISFKVFLEEGIQTLCMKNQDKEYHFQISADKSTVKTDITLLKESESFFLLYFLRTAYGITSAYQKTLKIHASVIEKDGKALVFLGKSGTGKSTHSKLWQKYVHSCSLLNDDEPIIRIMNDGSIKVFGAPWSGSTPCYKNIFAKVSAFVHLYQSSENRLTKLNGVESFASLLQSTAIMRSDSNNRSMVISVINDILNKISVYRLDNRPDREAVALTETLL
jgi:hypothetical protein